MLWQSILLSDEDSAEERERNFLEKNQSQPRDRCGSNFTGGFCGWDVVVEFLRSLLPQISSWLQVTLQRTDDWLHWWKEGESNPFIPLFWKAPFYKTRDARMRYLCDQYHDSTAPFKSIFGFSFEGNAWRQIFHSLCRTRMQVSIERSEERKRSEDEPTAWWISMTFHHKQYIVCSPLRPSTHDKAYRIERNFRK